jgi:hypothetical protein
MTDVVEPIAEPVSKCDRCKQLDNHPKHQVLIGFGNENTVGSNTNGLFHNDDEDRDGVVSYHFDCDTPLHSLPGVDQVHLAKVRSLAQSGVHGDELRLRIQEMGKEAKPVAPADFQTGGAH